MEVTDPLSLTEARGVIRSGGVFSKNGREYPCPARLGPVKGGESGMSGDHAPNVPGRGIQTIFHPSAEFAPCLAMRDLPPGYSL